MSIDHHIVERQLRWFAHVSRMDFKTRIPRRMLSSWVCNKRPRGAPRVTYGRTMRKTLERLGIWDSWCTLVHDRKEWAEKMAEGFENKDAFQPFAVGAETGAGTTAAPPPPAPNPLLQPSPSPDLARAHIRSYVHVLTRIYLLSLRFLATGDQTRPIVWPRSYQLYRS